MESRQKERVYEEFDPTIEWERDSAVDTLKVYLPGFRKEQMKVQVTTARFLRISGERELGDNKVIKFRKEIPIAPNYDTNQITAKFERGILYIKHPKAITSDQKPPVEPPKQPPAKAPQPPKDAPKPPKPPQTKPQSPPKIESPKPKLPEIEPDKAKTPAERKEEVPNKVEEKKDDVSKKDETKDAGTEKKQEKVAGDLDSVGSGGKVAAGVQKYDYRQVLSDAVKNPKQVMEWIIATLLVVFFWLRNAIMKPIQYFKKSEN